MTVPSPTAAPGSTVVFSWPAYTGCPTGHALSGFNVITDGVITSGGPNRGPGETSIGIKIPSTAGQTTTTTYTAVCTDQESPISDAVSVTAQ